MKPNPLIYFKSHQSQHYVLNVLNKYEAWDQAALKLRKNFDIGRISKQKFISWYKKKIFSLKGGLKGAKEGDIVLVSWPSCRLLDILESRQKLEVGYLSARKNKTIYHIKTHQAIRVKATLKSLAPLPPFTLFGIESDGTIKHILGHLLDPYVDEKIVLASHATLDSFSKQALIEAASFGEFVDASLYQDRIDLRHLNFCTIDPDDAKDFDDAIYYDETTDELYVAIADVSEYVSPHLALDKEAQQRGFSIYLPHKSIPMLPPLLSEHLCSLKPLEDRLAFIWKIKLQKKNTIVSDAQLFLGIINSKRRFTYTQADRILQSDTSQDPIEHMLQRLFEQTQDIKEQRLINGYDFITEEEKILLDKDLNFLQTITHINTLSHDLIEECMLLANIASAQFLEKHVPQGIYRSHITPKQERLIELFSHIQSLGYNSQLTSDIHASITQLQQEAKIRHEQKEIDQLIIKSQAQAQYTTTNQGHFGLGFEAYTHFTSPIRRYVDLHLHRILKSLLHIKQANHLIKDLQKICDDANRLEKECALAELEFKDRVYARWAKEHEGYTLEATIINENYPAIARAKNPITGARLFIDMHGLTLFSNVIVQIAYSDILEAKIHCTYIKDI